MKKCWLKNIEGSYPNIEIGTQKWTIVGRCQETGLADVLVSKQHLRLCANLGKSTVAVELLGVNPSTLNDSVLEKDKEYSAKDGDIIEIIPKKYAYKVSFETIGKQNEKLQSSKKRKLEDNDDQPAAKQRKWEIDICVDAKNTSNLLWRSYNDGRLLIYTAKNCNPRKKIAAYDMDGTLITTKSGKVFPVNRDDWKPAFGTIRKILQEKHENNYKIVIFTNQAGISSGKTKISDIQTKIQKIVEHFDIPMQVFVATGDNYFRKPLPGMWQALNQIANGDVSIEIENSYYVGDAAGRGENKLVKKKKDHSCVDRLFALNVNISFFTPEEHFLKAKAEKWSQPEFDPRNLKLSSSFDDLPKSHDLDVVVMVGCPGSGKSYFCREYFKNYEIISRDALGTWQKCITRMTECLKNKQKVVIDNINGTKDARERFVTAAKKLGAKCGCFVMTTSFKHCEHNIAFRELTDSKHSKVNKIVLNTYRKNYAEPKIDEGFEKIVNVDFKPKFSNEKDEQLYRMFLLPN